MPRWLVAWISAATMLAVSVPSAADPVLGTSEATGAFAALSEQEKKALHAEVAKVEQSCRSHSIFSAYQDCSCFAGKFLEARLQDRKTSRPNLMMTVSKLCPNPPAISAYQKELCLGRMARNYPRAAGHEVRKFCACVGEGVADRYTSKPINSIRAQTQMVVSAGLACGYSRFRKEAERERKQRLEEQGKL